MKNLIKLITTITVLLGMFSQVNASEAYTFQDATLKAANGKTANVKLGVPLHVLKDMNKSNEVSITGFQDGNKIYSSAGKELLIATLKDGFPVVKKDGNKVELVGTIEKELITEDGKEVWEEQEEFYFEMCTQCHAAPEVNHHTMMEWEALFQPMKGFAKLDAEESSYLLRYLKSNASDGLLKTEH